MYDAIIIGAGPAGMTAAIYTARKNLKTLMLAKQAGGQMAWSNDVENYTGFSMVTGAELAAKFQEHLASLGDGIELKTGVEVTNIEKNITSFAVEDAKGETYYGRAVIIASGREPKHLGIPGEDRFFGKGVSTCATCDGPLYKGKTVAVVGGGNSAMDAIWGLAKIAKNVYVININDDFAGDVILKDKIISSPNITLMHSTKALEIIGEQSVSAVRVQRFGKSAEELPVQGVFVEIGYVPSARFDQLTEKNSRGEIKVDRNLETTVPGIFAAGDINDAWGEQIIIAAGEGAKAAMAASDYLSKLK